MLKKYNNESIILVNSLGMGGAEKIALMISNGLNIKIITLEPDCFYDSDNVLSLSHLPIFFPRFMHRLYSTLHFPIYVLTHNIKTVQSHMLISNIINALFSKIVGHRSILVQHSNLDKHLGRKGVGNLMRISFGFSDKLVCISKEMLNDARQKLPNVDSVLIHNPCDINNILNMSNEINEITGTNGDYYVVLGRLFSGKRLFDIINAFHMSKSNTNCFFIGDGPDMDILKNKVKILGLEDRLKFIGSRKNPFLFLKGAKAIILASESEGFPNCLIEAMVLGVPIISSDCKTGPGEIMNMDLNGELKCRKNEFGYLFKVGDVNTLANIISEFDSSDFFADDLMRQANKFSLNHALVKYKQLMN